MKQHKKKCALYAERLMHGLARAALGRCCYALDENRMKLRACEKSAAMHVDDIAWKDCGMR